MSKLIALKIDVTKVDKSRLFQGKNGAQYLDATFFLNEEAGQYGDHGMVVQAVSKEERESGVKGAILGNVKILGEFGDNNGGSTAPAGVTESDDIPF